MRKYFEVLPDIKLYCFFALYVFLLTPQVLAQTQAINTEVLSEVIVAKQEELKKRLLSDIVVRNVRTTNYATYNTLYYLVDNLIKEKNKTVMTQSIIKEIGRYTIAHLAAKYAVNKAFPDSISDNFRSLQLPEINLIDDHKRSRSDKKEQHYESNLKNLSSKVFLDTLASHFYSYAVDTLYKSLFRNKTLNDAGLFDVSINDRFIASGLEKDYNQERDNLKNKSPYHFELINSEIDKIHNLNMVSLKAINENFGVGFKELLDTISKYNFSKFPKYQTQKAFDISKIGVSLVLQKFDSVMQIYKQDVGKGAIVAKLGEIITKYVVFDLSDGATETYSYKIDVEAIILALENEFLNFSIVDIRKNWIGVKPFFNIGFSYGYFTNQSNTLIMLADGTTSSLNQISLASEKIGVKFIFADYKYTRSQKPNTWYQYQGSYWWWNRPPKSTIINNFYVTVYASGILYNIVDVKSENTFSYPIIGTGIGAAFFNDLELNLSLAQPLLVDQSNPFDFSNSFIAVGFDVPIFEYLKALKKR